MSSDLRKQIYNNHSLKETDELVDIWQTNNRLEWSDATFDAIEEILLDRRIELPPQNEPVLELVAKDTKKAGDGILKKLTGEENEPVFYNPQEVFWLVRWLNRLALASIAATVVVSLLELGATQRIVLSYYLGNSPWAVAAWGIVAWGIALVIFVFAVGLQSAIYYFGFKALETILKILMEWEFNSRGVK